MPIEATKLLKTLLNKYTKLSAQLESFILQTMESHKKRQVYPVLITPSNFYLIRLFVGWIIL